MACVGRPLGIVALVLLLAGLPGLIAWPTSVAAQSGAAWQTVDIGIASDLTSVSADGLRCESSSGVYRIAPGSQVTLSVAGSAETRSDAVSSVPIAPAAQGAPVPGEGCELWVSFSNVPMVGGYQIEIAPAAGSDLSESNSAAAVLAFFWTNDFTPGDVVDGEQECQTPAANGALPATGNLIDGFCRTPIMGLLPFSPPYRVVLGDMTGPVTPPLVVTNDTPTRLAPIKGPAWLKGAVERRLIVAPGDASGIEGLSFLTIAFDSAGMPQLDSEEVQGILGPVLGEVSDDFVRSMAITRADNMQDATGTMIADFSQTFVADAPGAATDYGVVLFWKGTDLHLVQIAARGEGTVLQLEAIAAEWATVGGAGENGWRLTNPGPDSPRTDGLWGTLPLPGQLDTLPVGFRVGGDWLVAEGE